MPDDRPHPYRSPQEAVDDLVRPENPGFLFSYWFLVLALLQAALLLSSCAVIGALFDDLAGGTAVGVLLGAIFGFLKLHDARKGRDQMLGRDRQMETIQRRYLAMETNFCQKASLVRKLRKTIHQIEAKHEEELRDQSDQFHRNFSMQTKVNVGEQAKLIKAKFAAESELAQCQVALEDIGDNYNKLIGTLRYERALYVRAAELGSEIGLVPLDILVDRAREERETERWLPTWRPGTSVTPLLDKQGKATPETVAWQKQLEEKRPHPSLKPD